MEFADRVRRVEPSATIAISNLSAELEAAGVDVSSDRRTDPTVNVSIVNGSTLQAGARTPATDGGDTLAWGQYRQYEPVTSSRVVRLTGYDCDSVCWVVVRVW